MIWYVNPLEPFVSQFIAFVSKIEDSTSTSEFPFQILSRIWILSFVSELWPIFEFKFKSSFPNFYSNLVLKLRFWVLIRISIRIFICRFVVESGASFPTSSSNKNSEKKLQIWIRLKFEGQTSNSEMSQSDTLFYLH